MELRLLQCGIDGKEIDIGFEVRTMCGMRLLLLMGVFIALFGGLGYLQAQDEDPASLAKASSLVRLTRFR